MTARERHCMRAAGRIMMGQGSGGVINMASMRAFTPNPGLINYCAPKSAVVIMTQIAAAEWGPDQRHRAGVVSSPMWDADVARGAVDNTARSAVVPLGPLGLPTDIGQLAVVLASDASSYLTGSCVTIDGGAASLRPG